MMRLLALLLAAFCTVAQAAAPGSRGLIVASGWTPANMGSHLNLWLDPSAMRSLSLNSGNVNWLCDAREVYPTCSRRLAIQTTPANQVPLTLNTPATGLNVLAPNPAATTFLQLTPLINTANAYTCWFVVSLGATQSFPFGYSSSYASYPLFTSTTTIFTSNTGYYLQGTASLGVFEVIAARSTGAAAANAFTLTVNGRPIALSGGGATTKTGLWDQMFNANSSYSDGQWGEMFCSNQAESDATMAAGTQYLKTRWRIH